MTRDPHQMRNLADDPAHITTRNALEKRLLEELRRTHDPRMIDDGKFFETPPMAGPIGGKSNGVSPEDLRRGLGE